MCDAPFLLRLLGPPIWTPTNGTTVSVGWTSPADSRATVPAPREGKEFLRVRLSELGFGRIGPVWRVIRTARGGLAGLGEARRLGAPAVTARTLDHVRVDTHHDARL